MQVGFKSRSKRTPHYLAASLCYDVTRPPLGHDKACVTKNFLPQPWQSVGRFKGKIPYRRKRLSWNPFLENSVPLRLWGIVISHASFYVIRQRKFSPVLSDNFLCLVRAAFSENFRFFRPSVVALRTHLLCTTYLRLIPPRSDPTKT